MPTFALSYIDNLNDSDEHKVLWLEWLGKSLLIRSCSIICTVLKLPGMQLSHDGWDVGFASVMQRASSQRVICSMMGMFQQIDQTAPPWVVVRLCRLSIRREAQQENSSRTRETHFTRRHV